MVVPYIGFQFVNDLVRLVQNRVLHASQRLIELDVNLQVLAFVAKVAGEPVNVALGLLFEIGRRHHFPAHRNRFFTDLDLQVAQEISRPVLQRLIRQHLAVDAVVGIGVLNGGVVDLGILNSLEDIDRHQVVEEAGEDYPSQQ